MSKCSRCLHEKVCEKWAKLKVIYRLTEDVDVPKSIDEAVGKDCEHWLCHGTIDALLEKISRIKEPCARCGDGLLADKSRCPQCSSRLKGM